MSNERVAARESLLTNFTFHLLPTVRALVAIPRLCRRKNGPAAVDSARVCLSVMNRVNVAVERGFVSVCFVAMRAGEGLEAGMSSLMNEKRVFPRERLLTHMTNIFSQVRVRTEMNLEVGLL